MIYFAIFAPKIQPAQQLSRLNLLQADLIQPERVMLGPLMKKYPFPGHISLVPPPHPQLLIIYNH